jgi:hypothetical protein
MQIDYVTDLGGDWAGIYTDGDLFYDGHSIPDDTWMKLLRLAAYLPVEIREWVSDLEMGGRYPDDFLDLIEELREAK